jgi:hypothetical protein
MCVHFLALQYICKYIYIYNLNLLMLHSYAFLRYYRVTKSISAPDDYNTKNEQKCFKQFQSFTMIT